MTATESPPNESGGPGVPTPQTRPQPSPGHTNSGTVPVPVTVLQAAVDLIANGDWSAGYAAGYAAAEEEAAEAWRVFCGLVRRTNSDGWPRRLGAAAAYTRARADETFRDGAGWRAAAEAALPKHRSRRRAVVEAYAKSLRREVARSADIAEAVRHRRSA